jgi:hypothetical protein
VHRGLPERAKTLSALAGEPAHALGHRTRRPSEQQMQQAQGANVGLARLWTLTIW